MKKKIGAIPVCILLIISSLVIVSPVQAMKLSGNTLYVGGSGTGNYTRIQDAIDNASDGDTVFVYSGTYFGTINVDKSIILQGQDKNSTILDGESTKHLIRLRKNNIQISGFTIRNAYYGIYTHDFSNHLISDNIIEDVTEGIQFNYWYEKHSYANIKKSTISNCIIRGTDYGIVFRESNNDNIINNRILNNDVGIDLCDSSYNIINNNIFENNKKGIWLTHFWMFCRYEYSNSNTITYNNFTKNECGIYIEDNHNNNKISENNFIKNTISATFGYGLYPFSKKNIFSHNYWDRARTSPKLIFGILGCWFYILPLFIPWFIVDWDPSIAPFDIP